MILRGLPDACPHCGHKTEDWPLVVYHLRLCAECPRCHCVAIPIHAGSAVNTLADLPGLAELYESGMSMSELAGHYGVNKSTIHRALRRAGIPARPRGRAPHAAADVVASLRHLGTAEYDEVREAIRGWDDADYEGTRTEAP